MMWGCGKPESLAAYNQPSGYRHWSIISWIDMGPQ